MKSFLTLAAALAAFTSVSSAAAQDRRQGHWEWRTQPSSGPRSNVSAQVRVWVKDDQTRMANCDCAMMKADAANCMMDMRGSQTAPLHG